MILESRTGRRRRPEAARWAGVEWNWDHPAPRPQAHTARNVLVGGSLAVLGLIACVQLLRPHDLQAAPPSPEWIEMEPPRQQSAAPVPRPQAPRPTSSAPAASQPLPGTPETPLPPQALGDPSPSPSGSMTVAQGTAEGTSAEETPPAPAAPSAPAGPVSVPGVPASVAPLLPGYPARAEAEGREGTVVALVVTDTLGRVVDLRIEKSAGRDFDESVRRAALSSRFVVPRRDGKALAVAFRLPYRFRLD